jgi:hypothetical protein
LEGGREKLNIQVTETNKTVLGLEHTNTLIRVANLASAIRNQGRWEEAEELDIQVTETKRWY